jgi:hypothetical protein
MQIIYLTYLSNQNVDLKGAVQMLRIAPFAKERRRPWHILSFDVGTPYSFGHDQILTWAFQFWHWGLHGGDQRQGLVGEHHFHSKSPRKAAAYVICSYFRKFRTTNIQELSTKRYTLQRSQFNASNWKQHVSHHNSQARTLGPSCRESSCNFCCFWCPLDFDLLALFFCIEILFNLLYI